MIRCSLLTLLLFSVAAWRATAQAPLPAAFVQQLDAAQIEYFEPVEQQFRPLRALQNAFFPCDHALRKKKSRLEIRYRILPNDGSPLSALPQLRCLTTATHLASNGAHSTLAVHSIPADQVQEQYRADWGGIVFFQPKTAFSTRQHCKLLALYAEDKGLALIFFLFDQADEAPGDDWTNLRFR
ncbi:MAG: hypothetical protein AAFW73_17145 [Bacteroidota bacterium]